LNKRLRCEGLRLARQAGKISPGRVGAQQSSYRLDRRMKIGALDDVVAVEKRVPGEDQQIRDPGVEEGIVERLRIAHLTERAPSRPTRSESRRRENAPMSAHSDHHPVIATLGCPSVPECTLIRTFALAPDESPSRALRAGAGDVGAFGRSPFFSSRRAP
jgi:hypothetical protein